MRKLKNPRHWGPSVIGDGEMKKDILRHITELNTHCVITRVNEGYDSMSVDIKNLSPLEFKKLRQDRYEAALKAKQEREEANRKALEAQQAMDAEKTQIKKEIDNTYTGKWLNDKNFSSVQKQEAIKKFINKVYNKEITIEFLNAATPDNLVPINKKTDKDFVRIKDILAKDIVKQHYQLGNYWRGTDPLVNKINFFHTLQAATLMNSKITDEAKRKRRHDAAEQMGCLWLANAFTD